MQNVLQVGILVMDREYKILLRMNFEEGSEDSKLGT